MRNFEFLGEKIEITGEEEEYNEVFIGFDNRDTDTTEEFYEQYLNTEVLQKEEISKRGYELHRSAVEAALEVIKALGISGYDYERFIHINEKLFDAWSYALSMIDSQRETKEVAECLYDAMWQTNAGIMAVCFKILEKEKSSIYNLDDIRARKREADAIVERWEKGDIAQDKLKEELVKAIKLNYYNEDVYVLAMIQFGDQDNRLEAMAEFFGIDLLEDKLNLIEEYIKNNIDSVLSGSKADSLTMEQIETLREAIKSHFRFYGIPYDSSYREKFATITKIGALYAQYRGSCGT